MFLVEFAGGDVAEVKVFKNCSCTMLLKNLTDNSGRILQMVVFRRDLVRVKLKKRAARTGGSDVLEITIWLVKTRGDGGTLSLYEELEWIQSLKRIHPSTS